MRSFFLGTALLVVVACATTPAKRPIDRDNDQLESESCCCKWTPIGSDDGKPVYEDMNRMECGEKQGECLAAGNCAGAPATDE